MNVWSVAALGIGAMVGAGIFALLGQVVLIAHSAAWIAFIIGGVVAMFSGYSYARLAAKYPSDTGSSRSSMRRFRRGPREARFRWSIS